MPDVFITSNIANLPQILAKLGPEVAMRAMKRVARVARTQLQRRFERTVQSWRHRPDFEAIEEIRPDGVTLIMGTSDEVYGYVDRGTAPHTIAPKGPGYPLRFKRQYQAKTSPGSLTARQGGASGPDVFAMIVHHPGTEAREFTRRIGEEVGPLVAEETMRQIHNEMQRYFRQFR